MKNIKQNALPIHDFQFNYFKTKYHICSLFKRGKGTNVMTLEVHTVTTLEVYTVTTLEVYTVTTLEVYNVTTLEVYTIKNTRGILLSNIHWR